MNTIVNPLNDKLIRGTESFLINLNFISNQYPNIQNIGINNVLNEPEEKKEIKFLTRKKGRKTKFSENKNYLSDNIMNTSDNYIHDKFSKDNIRRKIKSLFHKYIISLFNSKIKKKFNNIKKRFGKMNKKITNNLGIEYNRNLFNQYIKDIIISISKRYSNPHRNRNCIKFISKQKDNEDIMKILNITYRDLYTDYYLKSTKNDLLDNSFEAHKEMLMKKYGKEYLDAFIENAENFIDFFIKGKNRKLRKPKEEVEVVEIPLENDDIENKSFNEPINNKDKNIYKTKMMVSTSVQTDIVGINKKLITFG